MSFETAGLALDADDLFGKWGFSDGALIDDWWESIHGEPPGFDTDEVLSALVQRHLVPAIAHSGGGHAGGDRGASSRCGRIEWPRREGEA